jgi:hypothetical protein
MGASASIDFSLIKQKGATRDDGSGDDDNDYVPITNRTLSAAVAQNVSNKELQIRNIVDNTAARLKLLKSNSDVCLKDWQDERTEESDVFLYARDLFYECAGEAKVIDMQVFQSLLDEILDHVEVRSRHINHRSRKQLSNALFLVLSEMYTCMCWEDIAALLSFISVNLDGSELLFEM